MNKLLGAQDAINQAIEGGYLSLKTNVDIHADGDVYISLDGQDFQYEGTTIIFLADPLFWQALGKARRWKWDVEMEYDVEKYYAVQWFLNRLSGEDETKFWQLLP